MLNSQLPRGTEKRRTCPRGKALCPCHPHPASSKEHKGTQHHRLPSALVSAVISKGKSCRLDASSRLNHCSKLLRKANNPPLNDGTRWHFFGCMPDAGIWYASLLMNHNWQNISPCMIYLDAMMHILEVNSSKSQQTTSTVSKCSSESEKSAVCPTGPTAPHLNQHTYLWLKTTLPMGAMSFTERLSLSETM